MRPQIQLGKSLGTMLIKLLLCTVFAVVCSYNVDTRFSIMVSQYKGTVAPTTGNSYFGYSVLLHSHVKSNQTWMFVGAPGGNYTEAPKEFPKGTGIVYRCPLHKLGTCTKLRPSVIENEEGFNVKKNTKLIIKKQRGWLGASMSIDRNNEILTVCAPRTVIEVIRVNDETTHGMCYTMQVWEDVMVMEDKNCATYDFNIRFWYNPARGFSIHHTPVLANRTNYLVHRVIGEPMHDINGRANVIHMSKGSFWNRTSISLPNGDELSLFGYSVTSGFFFRKDELLVASGAPGWRYVGQVGILNEVVKPPYIGSLRGTEVGAYFGASLASGDVNNDGLDDLLVGAPHSGNDNGRVFLYLGSAKKKFVATPSLRGSVDGGQFGYSIACGDLDADGFADIVVGAPWEENGVIYIYNGAANLGQEIGLQESQRISAAHTLMYNANVYGDLKAFGFSISEPVDIDNNGYPDVAVGAYKSGHALVLRGNPVVTTVLELQFVPSILKRSSREFAIKACPKYQGYSLQTSADFKISFTLDESHRRTKETHLQLMSSDFADSCVYTNVTILERVRDFIEPIAVEARHEFVNDRAKTYCKTCPVENRSNKMNVARELLAFDIGCGEDKVCHADILATATFHGVQDDDTWVIGSGAIGLAVNLTNLGEPAYLADLVFTLPEQIILRSILRACREDQADSNLIVTCDVGNPLAQGEKKEIKLDLDMRYLNNGSMHGSELQFLASINSRSANRGVKEIEKVLNLVADVSLSLNGQANEESYYLSAVDEGSANVTFQHIYQIYKLGMTPIDEARFTVKVPTAIQNWGTFLHVYQPQLIVSGEIYKCSSSALLLHHQESQYPPGQKSTDDSDSTAAPNEIYSRSERSSDTNAHGAAVFQETQSFAKSEMNQDIVDPLYPTEIININCTSPNVTCSTIVCNLSSLKSLTDTGKLVLKLVLERDALKVFQGAAAEDTKIFRLSSEAQVEIITPNNIVTIDGARSTIDVTTIFYSVPRYKGIQWWVIILSVSVGLLLLLIIATVLSVLGFFKRDSKEELDALKSKEFDLDNMNEDRACTADEDT